VARREPEPRRAEIGDEGGTRADGQYCALSPSSSSSFSSIVLDNGFGKQ
jgi:hypothetical protein